MSGGHTLECGAVVSWQGQDYVVGQCVLATGTHFSWRAAELVPAAAGETVWLAFCGPDLWEVEDLYGLGPPEQLPVPVDLLTPSRPAEAVEVSGRRFCIVRFASASFELTTSGGPALFDSGRLLEYAAESEQTRLVVFVSPRRAFAFTAKQGVSGELEVYGRPKR
ncbi:MAG: hypothetical protein H5T86_13090 [Armatimonadetes bacterium]|nr:hypothetical protein [Armatimonadota bacterium]